MQNLEKMDNNFYKDSGDGAINTRSSANASINKVKLAMVNSLHCYLVNVFYAKRCLI